MQNHNPKRKIVRLISQDYFQQPAIIKNAYFRRSNNNKQQIDHKKNFWIDQLTYSLKPLVNGRITKSLRAIYGLKQEVQFHKRQRALSFKQTEQQVLTDNNIRRKSCEGLYFGQVSSKTTMLNSKCSSTFIQQALVIKQTRIQQERKKLVDSMHHIASLRTRADITQLHKTKQKNSLTIIQQPRSPPKRESIISPFPMQQKTKTKQQRKYNSMSLYSSHKVSEDYYQQTRQPVKHNNNPTLALDHCEIIRIQRFIDLVTKNMDHWIKKLKTQDDFPLKASFQQKNNNHRLTIQLAGGNNNYLNGKWESNIVFQKPNSQKEEVSESCTSPYSIITLKQQQSKPYINIIKRTKKSFDILVKSQKLKTNGTVQQYVSHQKIGQQNKQNKQLTLYQFDQTYSEALATTQRLKTSLSKLDVQLSPIKSPKCQTLYKTQTLREIYLQKKTTNYITRSTKLIQLQPKINKALSPLDWISTKSQRY